MKKQSIILLILVFVLVIPSGADAEILNPTINSVSPNSFSAGETINISGDDFGNFENGPYYNRVYFGYSYNSNDIVSWNNNQISVTVPDSVYNINYGNEMGIHIELCTTCVSCGCKKSNYFTDYIIKPKINLVNGLNADISLEVIVGDSLIISGAGFGYSKGTVLVNGLNADIVSWDSLTIKIVVPNTSPGSGNVIVKTYNEVASDAFVLKISGAPEITSISPKILSADNEYLTIYGSGFGNMENLGFGLKKVPNNGRLYVGEFSYCGTMCGFSTNLDNWTDNKIKIGISQPGQIKFKKDGFDMVYGPYVYVQPEITSLNITTGKAGDELILKSSWANDFISVIPDSKNVSNYGAEIYFNDVKGTIKEISAWKIITTIPENAKSGKVKLVYRHNGTTIESFGPYLEILQPTAQDDLSAYQQYLQQTKVDQAWNYSHGSSAVVVAVIDDGVYTGHPDLDSNMWINYGEIEGNGKDDDNNGYIDDRWGWNFISNSKDMTTLGTHGTMVAGIIGAESNNTTGISGINWNIKLMPIIACDDNGCNGEAIVNAIKYAVNNGADIINLSLAGQVFNYTDYFNEVIKYAFDRNVLIVIAAGNGDVEGGIGRNLNITKVSPVCNDGNENIVLGVGSVNENNQITSWSNYGNCVDIYAPGEDIVSTAVPIYSTLSGFYDTADGTSFSTPIVSGIAALIKAKYPEIKNTAIRDRIINNSDYQNGFKITNAYKAISQLFTDSEKKIDNIISPVPITVTPNIPEVSQTKNITEENKPAANIDTKLSNRLKGRLLLQVEQGGAIWYVDTKEYKRYSVTWANALPLFEKLSLGITDADLFKIPIAGSNEVGSWSMRNRLKGKLLLQVQQNGNIWFVDKDGFRYSVTWNNLMSLFESLALGITNNDLNKIPVWSLEGF